MLFVGYKDWESYLGLRYRFKFVYMGVNWLINII